MSVPWDLHVIKQGKFVRLEMTIPMCEAAMSGCCGGCEKR